MKRCLLLAVAALTAAGLEAAVRLPHVFGDGMVLQQGRSVPVWGKADPGETVTVSFAGQSVSATADASGRWRLSLNPLAASSEGRELSISSSLKDHHSSVIIHDVVVGEVWFCSGQSNMEFPMGGLPWDATRRIKDSAREIAAADHPLLRHFKVKRATAKEPLEDVDAKWEVTTPATVTNKSAVAYVFGETLMKELDVPVGLIDCSWGGTRIEPWTPAGHPDDLWALQNAQKWNRAQDVPTVLWNGMVAGLVPYAIRGAIWYQGCANRNDGETYLEKTVGLVRGWRREWGQGDFPYFLVQLAPYKYDDIKGEVLPIIQRTQARVPSRVPNCGYTVINDVGNVDDIHPTDKRTVGMRLADQVLDRVYDRFVRPWKTPVATGMAVAGGEVRISFDDAEGLKTRDGLPPTEFEVRDLSGTWNPAAARIEGSDIVLALPSGDAASGVLSPCQGVRFAPYNGSVPNLVNGAGLPAGPFALNAGGLLSNWRLDPSARLDGSLLTIEVPKGASGGMARCTVDLSSFPQGVELQVRARGESITRPKERWLGTKFMLHYRDGEGFDQWPSAPQKAGSFDWCDLRFVQRFEKGVKGTTGELTLGLQNATGRIVFDLSTLRLVPFADMSALHPWGTGRLHLSHVHRGGGRSERPDNTLETFVWCWENGSALECDCRRTKDGVGVMLHDDNLKRTGRGIDAALAERSVSKDLTWDEIKDVDVGSYLGSRFAHERVPTIEATFAAMKGHPDYLCFVDEKGAGPDYIAARAIAAGVQDQVYYTGSSHEKIVAWNRVLPGGKSLLWIGAWPRDHGADERARADRHFREAMKQLRAKDFRFVSAVSIHSYYDPTDPVDPFVPSRDVLREIVQEFHRHGIPVVSIPFQGGETEDVYFKLWDLGFDGFSSDYPSVMFSVIQKLKEKAR